MAKARDKAIVLNSYRARFIKNGIVLEFESLAEGARKLGLDKGGAIEDINDISATKALKVYFKGAYGKEMSGLDKIITNTGTLFNINASVYDLWRGNVVSTTGTLNLNKVQKAVATAVERGLDEEAVLLVSPRTWQDLSAEQSAYRKFDSSYDSKEMENGSERLVFYSQNGKIEVISHNCVKAGEAFIVPLKRVKRVGSTDITFETPGRSDEIFLHLANNAGFELRCYADQAILVETPARCVKITGIVNS